MINRLLRYFRPTRVVSATTNQRRPTLTLYQPSRERFFRADIGRSYDEDVYSWLLIGTRYMVVDCGGGSIDITVHELVSVHRPVAELHKVCGAPFGSTGSLLLLL